MSRSDSDNGEVRLVADDMTDEQMAQLARVLKRVEAGEEVSQAEAKEATRGLNVVVVQSPTPTQQAAAVTYPQYLGYDPALRYGAPLWAPSPLAVLLGLAGGFALGGGFGRRRWRRRRFLLGPYGRRGIAVPRRRGRAFPGLFGSPRIGRRGRFRGRRGRRGIRRRARTRAHREQDASGFLTLPDEHTLRVEDGRVEFSGTPVLDAEVAADAMRAAACGAMDHVACDKCEMSGQLNARKPVESTRAVLAHLQSCARSTTITAEAATDAVGESAAEAGKEEEEEAAMTLEEFESELAKHTEVGPGEREMMRVLFTASLQDE